MRAMRIECPRCGAAYRVGPEQAGKVARCAKCGARMVVPSAPEAPEGEQVAVSAFPGEAPAPVSGMMVRKRVRRNNLLLLLPLVLGAVGFLAGAAWLVLGRRGAGPVAVRQVKVPPRVRPGARARAEAGPATAAAADPLAQRERMGALAREAEDLLAGSRVPADPNLTPAAIEASRAALAAARAKNAELAKLLGEARSLAPDDPYVARLDRESARRGQRAAVRATQLQDALWPGPGDRSVMYPKVRRGIPAVRNYGIGGGCGVLVARGERLYVVTCKRILAGGRFGFCLSFPQPDANDPAPCTPLPVGPEAVAYVHKAADLAAIDVTALRGRLAGEGIQPLRLGGNDGPKPSAEVWVVGHPTDPEGTPLPMTTAAGRVVRVGPSEGERVSIQTDMEMGPGNAGGPVFDAAGRVVGIAAGEGESAVHVRELRALLAGETHRMSGEQVARFLDLESTAMPALSEPDVHALSLRVIEQAMDGGYEPCGQGAGVRFRMAPGTTGTGPITARKGSVYAVAAVSASLSHVRIEVQGEAGKVCRTPVDKPTTAAVLQAFRLPAAGEYRLVVHNLDRANAQVRVYLFEKAGGGVESAAD